MAILEANNDQDTKREALKTLTQVLSIDNATVANNSISLGPKEE